MEIQDYLDREVGDSDDSAEKLIAEMYGKDTSKKFTELHRAVYEAWGDSFFPAEEIEKIEGRCYNFIYNTPDVEKFCLVKEVEKATLEYLLPLIKGRETILDVGCGSGLKSVFYALENGSKVVAMDKLDSALQSLKERAEKYGLDIETVNANIRDFDLKKQFDAVLATCVLHESGDCRIESSFYGYGPQTWISEKVKNVVNHISPNGLFIGTFKELPYGDMCESIAYIVEKMGLIDIAIEDLLEGGDYTLRAIKAVKTPI